ncbi:response regulator [Marinoscillum sp.]|uniref:response regulator n=1 Tax=Marinoscillum sp. TaxID=2024838 RepID=UPI003BABA6ED
MPYRILTIEDDLLIAEDLRFKLEQLGYVVVGNARSGEEAIKKTKDFTPEIIIADILIEGDLDGVETVTRIYQFHRCPVIYLTANSESVTVKKAMQTHPAAFLIKPFKISEFTINIDLAIANFKSKNQPYEPSSDAIFVPDNFLYHKVYKKDIIYVEADGAYVKVITETKNYQLTTNLKTFIAQFDHPNFYRVSRKHLINTSKVDRINGNMLYLKGKETEFPITISKPQRAEILSKFEIIRTKG